MMRRNILARPRGWEATSGEADAFLGSLRTGGTAWRGMTEREYASTVARGLGVKSRGDMSASFEGTQFADDPRDAESYVNFGRDDPRKTGAPTYLVQVSAKSLRRKRDGYLETERGEAVSQDQIVSVWKCSARDSEVHIEQVPLQTKPSSMKHRRLMPNAIPTPPMSAYPAAGSTTLAPAAFGAWVERTYKPGTRVAFPNGILTFEGRLPAGARGVVEAVTTDWGKLGGAVEYQLVHVRVTDARDSSGLPLPQFANHLMKVDSLYYYAAGENMTHAVTPLDDNWGAAPPSKRTSLPASQRGLSLKHRRLLPNKRTSKRRTSRRKSRIRA